MQQDQHKFYYKSPTTVFWYSLLTFGIYHWVWFYKHWKVANGKHSVWTTLLPGLYVEKLVSKFYGDTKPKMHLVSTCFILSVLACYILIGFITTPICLAWMQKIANDASDSMNTTP